MNGYMAPWDQSLYFEPPTQRLVSVGVAAVTLLGENSRRVGFVVSAPSGANVSIGIVPTITTGFGIILAGAQLTQQFTQREFGPLVALQWFAIAGGPGINVSLIEVVLSDWPQRRSLAPTKDAQRWNLHTKCGLALG